MYIYMYKYIYIYIYGYTGFWASGIPCLTGRGCWASSMGGPGCQSSSFRGRIIVKVAHASLQGSLRGATGIVIFTLSRPFYLKSCTCKFLVAHARFPGFLLGWTGIVIFALSRPVYRTSCTCTFSGLSRRGPFGSLWVAAGPGETDRGPGGGPGMPPGLQSVILNIFI